MITLDQLTTIFPHTPEETLTVYIAPLNTFLPQYEIDTNLRIAMFLAQVGVESNYFRATEGNYNYSALRLTEVFPVYFQSLAEALPFDHQPEKIVIFVYGGRMGNAPSPSDDAWVYRERGLIQLTGKDNYVAFAKDKNMSLDDVVTYLGTTEGVTEVAAWFFKSRNVNGAADEGDVLAATKLINGGEIGLAQRQACMM